MIKRQNIEESLWITNISKRDIHLSDLGVMIRSMTSINLLDKKHYNLKKEQIQLSINSGSIFKRGNKIAVRKVAPNKTDAIIDAVRAMERDQPINFPFKHRSTVIAEDVKYEELNVDDVIYAEENAEMAEQNHVGRFNKRKL